MFNVDLTKKYGILLSGGIDSAVLLALLLKYYPTISIQPYTIPKHDGASNYVNNIIAHLNEKFKSLVPQTLYVGDPNVHHRQQSRTAVLEIFEKYSIDFLFNGLNQNPPELANDEGAPLRDTVSTSPKIILPFVNFYKDKILELMYENNLEELAEITHSCTELQMTRCHQCWQCRERKWAFAQINKLDKGTF